METFRFGWLLEDFFIVLKFYHDLKHLAVKVDQLGQYHRLGVSLVQAVKQPYSTVV